MSSEFVKVTRENFRAINKEMRRWNRRGTILFVTKSEKPPGSFQLQVLASPLFIGGFERIRVNHNDCKPPDPFLPDWKTHGRQYWIDRRQETAHSLWWRAVQEYCHLEVGNQFVLRSLPHIKADFPLGDNPELIFVPRDGSLRAAVTHLVRWHAMSWNLKVETQGWDDALRLRQFDQNRIVRFVMDDMQGNRALLQSIEVGPRVDILIGIARKKRRLKLLG